MAATIAPGRLLGTLKVLLSPSGGIKSHQEVGRLVSLMQKFSRKLVSKVIYVHILRSSTPKLLEVFLVESGWELLYSWLSRAIISSNWPLCAELLDLLSLCPPPPHPTRQGVQDLLLAIQHQQDHQAGHVSALASQITSKWSQPVKITASNLSSLSKTVVDFSAGSSLQDSPMTLSRRCKRTVIVSNPHVVANTSPVSGPMVVTYQEKPLQNIVDVFKFQRRRGKEDIEAQVWMRVDERKRKSAPRLLMLAPSREKCQFEELTTSVSLQEKSDGVGSLMTRPRSSVKTPLGTVSVVNDQVVTQIENLHAEAVEDEVNEEANPLKIFEEITNELKENLKFEKHITVNQVSKQGRLGGNVWGMKNNENVTGFEGSAKDYRLARRERFREEQKLLEEQTEAQERKEREVKRERMKKVKREEDRRAKMVKEMDEKKRKMELEVEERKRREKLEEEFKKRREEERLRRKEKERQERNLGSMKSELKDGLNSDEKSRIKLIVQQMKKNSELYDSTSMSVVQGRIPKFGKIITSGQAEAAQASKPAKPLFSVAKNKNKDLLASLEAPLKPAKRPMVVARDPLVKKSGPPFLTRKLPTEPKLNCVDYGTSSLALDSAPHCLNIKEDGNDEVSSKKVVKAGSEEVRGDASNSFLQRDDQLDQVVVSDSVTPTKIKETMFNDKNEMESKTIETSHRDHQEEVNKSCEKVSESKKSSHDKKTELQKCRNDKKIESKKSHHDKKIEAKKSHVDKNFDAKKSCDDKKMELKKSHDKKTDSKEGHDHDGKAIKTKSPLTLKPVSQLKESSLFGSLLKNVEKSSQKKRKSSFLGSDHNKNFKYSKTEKVKAKDDPAVSKTAPAPVPVPKIPRKVSGILIVEHSSVMTKRTVRWRDDKELVQVEYFEVDSAERVNVHKLKFEEVRQQELVKERNLLSTRHNSMEKEGDEKPWKGLKVLDNCGRGNFMAGSKSGEREIQRMREERVLPIVCFGNIPINPSEPELSMNSNILGVETTRDILSDDISGEGTEVDYSAEGWPEPALIMSNCEDGIRAGQFYGGGGGHDQEHGRHAGEGMGPRFSSSHPHSRGFGRGAVAASWATRGFRGGFETHGRGGFGGKRNVSCKYWRRGACRDGQDCKFLHI